MDEVSTKMGVFQGDGVNKVFLYSVENIQQKKYKFAGELMLWSLGHGGPGLPVMNLNLFRLMINSEETLMQGDNFSWTPPGCDYQFQKVGSLVSSN